MDDRYNLVSWSWNPKSENYEPSIIFESDDLSNVTALFDLIALSKDNPRLEIIDSENDGELLLEKDL